MTFVQITLRMVDDKSVVFALETSSYIEPGEYPGWIRKAIRMTMEEHPIVTDAEFAQMQITLLHDDALISALEAASYDLAVNLRYVHMWDWHCQQALKAPPRG